jgi:hypothetical protein
MDKTKLAEILASHALWLQGDAKGTRANLSGAALSGANLSRAALSGADLSGANLGGAALSGANLGGASLSGANLSGANLSYANLGDANLSYASLSGANLSYANLSGADLYGANLSGVKNAELAIARTVLVSEGTPTVWKKLQGGIIATLRVPEKARRSSASGRKCRAEYVKVLALSGKAKRGISQHDGKTIYEVGKIVRCDKWCEDRWQECAGGIHFYLTREEAEAN